MSQLYKANNKIYFTDVNFNIHCIDISTFKKVCIGETKSYILDIFNYKNNIYLLN